MKKIFTFFLIIPILLTGCSKNKERVTFVSCGNEFETLYSDSYFLLDNKDYHQEIALASFASARASISEEDYSIRSKYLTDLWEKEGFENIYINQSYKEKPKLDSIGVGIASKKIEDFTLITVTVRSGGYGAEWASNFTIGGVGHVKGFTDAAITVIKELDTYITKTNITGRTKFWLNGYSRGGAVTNLTAGRLLNNIKNNVFFANVTSTYDDFYAYCFEPPLCALISEEEALSDMYKGIHNVLNFNDIIPKVAPHDWGFIRYGRNYFYPDRLTDIYFDAYSRKKLVSDYHFMKGAHKLNEYTVDNWKFYDPGEEGLFEKNPPRETVNPSQGLFGTTLMHEIGTGYISRAMYASLEEDVRDLIAAFFGYNAIIGDFDISGEALINILFSYSFVQAIFTELQHYDFQGFAGDLEYLFYAIFNANDDNIDAIKELYNNVYYLILFLSPSLVSREDVMLQLFSRDNILSITYPHYSDINYSFLLSCDTRVYGDSACKMNDGTYQILHIENPVNVSLYETHLKQTIFTYKNEKMSSEILCCEKLNDGSLNLYLPFNGTYEYQAECDGLVLYKVNQYGDQNILVSSLNKSGTI